MVTDLVSRRVTGHKAAIEIEQIGTETSTAGSTKTATPARSAAASVMHPSPRRRYSGPWSSGGFTNRTSSSVPKLLKR